jgi:predicted transcriptional regulator
MPQTVPVEVSDEALQMIQEFASRQRMNTSMLLSSAVQSYAETYIYPPCLLTNYGAKEDA